MFLAAQFHDPEIIKPETIIEQVGIDARKTDSKKLRPPWISKKQNVDFSFFLFFLFAFLFNFLLLLRIWKE